MEAIGFYSSSEKPYSPSNLKNRRTYSSIPCENLAPINYQNGILQTPPHPPFLYHSFPPFLAHQQPPLLPLPISNGLLPHYVQKYTNFERFNPPLGQQRTLSCPSINRRLNKSHKKSKSFIKSNPKKEETPKSSKVKEAKKNMPSKLVVTATTNPLGPDPKDLPKDVSMVMSSSPTGKKEDSDIDKVNKFSGSVVFTVSPPPSSLPLPTFSLRPKLSCKTEAAGVDDGATNNLRRLLKLG